MKMADSLLLSVILFTACFFYFLGSFDTRAKHAKRGRSAAYHKALTKPEPADKQTSAEKKEPPFYCSDIAEGYANMATGGAFIKSKKRREGLFK